MNIEKKRRLPTWRTNNGCNVFKYSLLDNLAIYKAII